MGVARVDFILDAVPEMTISWWVVLHVRTQNMLDAIETTLWSQEKHLPELWWRLDGGSQFTSIYNGEGQAELGDVPWN